MSATLNREIRDFITLFQETWAECQSYRAKDKIEAAGQKVNWEESLAAAQVQARELFEPIFSCLAHNSPLPHILEQVQERLEASRS